MEDAGLDWTMSVQKLQNGVSTDGSKIAEYCQRFLHEDPSRKASWRKQLIGRWEYRHEVDIGCQSCWFTDIFLPQRRTTSYLIKAWPNAKVAYMSPILLRQSNPRVNAAANLRLVTCVALLHMLSRCYKCTTPPLFCPLWKNSTLQT